MSGKLLQALKSKWLNWIASFWYTQALPCISIPDLDRLFPQFRKGMQLVFVVGWGVREAPLWGQKLQFWGNFVKLVFLKHAAWILMSLRGVHALVASIEEKVTQLSYRFQVFPGFTVQFNSRFGQAWFRQFRKASNWCWCCWLPCAGDILCEDKVAILGQLCESGFVKHAAWILISVRVSTHLLQALKGKRLNRITYFGYSQGFPWNSIGGFDRPGFCNSGRACNWCCVVSCGVPETTLWGQVSSNFVNHTAWIWIECESVYALVASIELASDSIELLLSDIPR